MVKTWPFIAPSVGVLLVWMIVPLVMTLWFSFQRYNLLNPFLTGFAGLENYTYLLTDPALGASLVLLVALALGGWWEAGRRPAPPPGAGAVQTIAVLPLTDLTGGAGPPHLAEALTDQLIATLGRLHGLRVTSRTSVMALEGRGVPVPQLARRLGVATVLEGTVTVSGRSPFSSTSGP